MTEIEMHIDTLEKLIPEIEMGMNLFSYDRSALQAALQALRRIAEDDKARLCKVGEDVFFVFPDFDGYLGYFVSEPHKVTEVGTRGFWTSSIPDDDPDEMGDFTPWSDFGKTVFLTRQAAEAALDGGGEGG